jgi:hypothetical protein
MSKSILYNKEMYELDNILQYDEYQDLLNGITGETNEEQDASYEWITYKFLMNHGYLVSEPKMPDPTKAPESKTKSKPKSKSKVIEPRVNIPEPEWTPSKLLQAQSKILKEQARFLKEKEKAHEKRELEFEKKEKIRINKEIDNHYKAIQNRPQFYHADGRPYNRSNYINSIIVMFIILMSAVLCLVTFTFAKL